MGFFKSNNELRYSVGRTDGHCEITLARVFKQHAKICHEMEEKLVCINSLCHDTV